MSAVPEGVKEWVKVTRSPSGMFVTVTWQRETNTVKWTVKVYEGVKGAIKKGVTDARTATSKALTELEEALS